MPSVPRQRVSSSELRARFNAGNYLQRATSGEFTPVLKDECTPRSEDEPPGTRSQTVRYLDQTGEQVFIVHRYLRPDGTLGASGRPDPKWLLEDGIVYFSAAEKRK